MNKTYKYVTLGVMVVCLIGLLWSGWRLERTIENMNQTIQEIEQIEKKIDLLEKELISEISSLPGIMFYPAKFSDRR